MSKSKNGITLIALIITIIVLLILAGVSISVLTGDNGVISNAQKASELTNKARIIEKIQMEISSIQAKKLGQTLYDYEIIGAIKKYGTVSNTVGKTLLEEILMTETNLSIPVSEIYNGSYIATLVSKIKPNNYGDAIDYIVTLDNDNMIDNWKILFNDGENIFLILDEVLEKDNIPTTLNLIIEDNGNSGWASPGDVPSGKVIEEDVAKKYRFQGLDNYSSAWQNYKVCANMLDVEVWDGFANSDFADSAIGTPTLGLFIDSWNQKYNDESSRLEYLVTTSDTWQYYGYAYIVNGVTQRWIPNNIVSNLEGYSDSLYFTALMKTNNSHLRIAAPNVGNTGSLKFVRWDGEFGFGGSISQAFMRPVVCLKNTVDGEKNNITGIWEIK